MSEVSVVMLFYFITDMCSVAVLTETMSNKHLAFACFICVIRCFLIMHVHLV